MSELFYVYILKCNDESYYVSHSDDNIKEKIMLHKQGFDKTSYTFTRLPVELVYFTTFVNLEEALDKEKQLKGWSRAKKEALINGDFELLKSLSKKKS